VRESPLTTYERDLELIEWCERWGFDEAWIGEHHSAAWENIPDPVVFLAAASQRTRTIRLGTGVVSLPYHHPLMVADRIVQLDYLSRGRAMLGVGPGALVSDSMMIGIDPVRNRAKMNEALGVITRLLAGEVVSHYSDWFTLHEAQVQILPVNGRLPIAVASTTSPAGMVCAGEFGAGVLSLGAGLIGDKKDLAEQWQLGVESAEKHGQELRREEWRLVIRAHLSHSREQAIAEVRDGRDRERSEYFRRVAGLRNEMTLEDEIAQDTALVGTPDDMIAAIERMQEATGGFGGYLVLAHDWADREATLRSYELMGRHVIPEFNGQMEPLRRSYDTVVANKRTYGGPALESIRKAYEDAGIPMPADLTGSNLR
jgi:limonene 1,2-monooxygenase